LGRNLCYGGGGNRRADEIGRDVENPGSGRTKGWGGCRGNRSPGKECKGKKGKSKTCCRQGERNVYAPTFPKETAGK